MTTTSIVDSALGPSLDPANPAATDTPAGQPPPEDLGAGGAAADEGEVTVTIGEEPGNQETDEERRAPEWVRELRKNHRETVRKNKELEEKLKALTTETKPAVTLAKKPTLADFDYDEEQFDAALDQWHETKRQVEEQKKTAAEAEARANADWQARLDSYAHAKTELKVKVKDFDEAEAEAKIMFSVTQQGIIIQGSENPALVVYAAGKNPEQGQRLAAIQDPVKFAFAVAKLEAQLKITKKSTPPPPEEKIISTGRTAGTVDSTLERLRSEAEKTGDYTKVAQYKKQQRAKTT